MFPCFLDSYLETCEVNLYRDGRDMVDPFGEPRGEFQYGAIADRLKEIGAQLRAEEARVTALMSTDAEA